MSDTPFEPMTVSLRATYPDHLRPVSSAYPRICRQDGGEWLEQDWHCVFSTRNAWERSQTKARIDAIRQAGKDAMRRRTRELLPRD